VQVTATCINEFGHVVLMSKDARPSSSFPLYSKGHLAQHIYLPTTTYSISDMADPSGAAPQPGPDDISTAILRPKKSCVFLLRLAGSDV